MRVPILDNSAHANMTSPSSPAHNQPIRHRITGRLIWALFILNFVNLVWFICFRYQQLAFNSDSAKKVLLAKEIFDSGQYFPKEWMYANQDLWIFSWHTLIVPLLNFLPAGYVVHAIAALTASVLIFASIWLVLSTFGINRTAKGVVLATFASGMSLTLTENLFGQVSYGTIFLHYCLILLSVWKVLEQRERAKVGYGLLLAFLLLTIAWANPGRAIIYYVAPLLCGIGFYAAHAVHARVLEGKSRGIINVLLFIVAGATAGAVLNKMTMPLVLMHEGVTQLKWISLSSAFEKIPKVFRSLLFILGGEPHAGRSLYTVSAIYDGFRLITAICFIGLIPSALKRIFTSGGSQALQFVTVFACSAFAIVTLLILTTNIYNGRYLLPAVLLTIVVVLSLEFDFRRSPVFDAIRLLVIVGFLSNVFVVNTSYWATYHVSEAHQDDYQNYDKPFELAQFLQEQGLKYGYATFWNASVITVLTDERTVVNQIYLRDGVPLPLKWQSTERAFQPSNYQGESFLLLSDGEAKAVNWSFLASQYGLVPSRTLQYKNYQIFVFPENLSVWMLKWQAG